MIKIMEKKETKKNYVAAIDIGTTKIVAIVGEKERNGKIKVVGMCQNPSRGVKRGVVLNIDEAVGTIKNAVEAVQIKTGVMFEEIYVGIAGQHIRSIKNRGYVLRDSSEDEITKEEVERLKNEMNKININMGEEIIHILPQNYVVDDETGVKQPVGMSGRKFEGNYHIVIGQIAVAKNIEKCVNKLGLKVKDMILEQLASAKAVLTEEEKEAGVALVDIGGGTTDLVVYYDNIIQHTAVIPYGGNVITNDIKEGCSTLMKVAEDLKIQYGSALPDVAPEDKVVSIPGINGREHKEISFKSLSKIIHARMEEIIDLIAFEIENSGYYDKLGAGIVITGGGAMLKHLPQLIKFKTGLDVKIGYPSESLAAEIDGDINKPQFSTSIGLILQGFEHLAELNQDGVSLKDIFEEKEEEIENDIEKKKTKSGVNVLDSFKNALYKIFEEDDTKM